MTGEQKFLRKLGQRIRLLRVQKGWSQEELAQQSGLHRTYISSVEQGKRNLAALNLRSLAEAYGISISELFTDVE